MRDRVPLRYDDDDDDGGGLITSANDKTVGIARLLYIMVGRLICPPGAAGPGSPVSRSTYTV